MTPSDPPMLGASRRWIGVVATGILAVAATPAESRGMQAESTSPIAAVRADADGDGVPDRLGDTVTVTGRATTSGSGLAGDQLRLFMQDGSGGIMAFGFDVPSPVARGDSVVVTGTVAQYAGLTEILVTGYRVVDVAPRVPEPVELPADPREFEVLEGSLVRVRGVVMGRGDNEGGRLLRLGPPDAQEPTLSVYVDDDHLSPPRLDRFRMGDRIEVTGPLGQFDVDPPFTEGYQIHPRSPEDLGAVGLARDRLERFVMAAGALLAVGLVALILMRFQVRRRTAELAASERAARVSETRLRFLLKHAPMALWTADLDLRLTWVEGRAMAGLDSGLLGTRLQDVFGTEDPDAPPLQAYARTLEGTPARFDVEWGGRTWEVRLEPLREDGRITGVLGAGLDVTPSRTVERRLEEQRIHFQRLFDESPEAIALLDSDDRVLQVNPEFERLFGYARAEAVGRTSHELISIPGRDSEAYLLTRRVAEGERVQLEAVRRRKDGREIDVSILATPVTVGEERRVYGIYRDITEQKAMEAQLLHSQKLEVVGQLAGGIAHDFNNILTAILGHTMVLLEEFADDERVLHDLEQIEAGGQRAAELTRQLLTFSRRDTRSPRAVDLSALVREARVFLERLMGERVRLDFQLTDDLPLVEVDPGQLEQVLVNLAVNARDAMGGEGRIRVSTWREDRLDVGDRTRDTPADSWAVLEVRDEGRGMTVEERARMFEPFFTTKPPGEGTGLGLSTAWGIIDQAGGTIEAESEVGVGTTFRVRLPSVERTDMPPDEPASDVPEGDRPSASGELILLVDDDRAVRDVTRRILEKAGVRVVAVESGAAAVEYCESGRAEPDLVLSDIVMAGMSGYQLRERLRDRIPDVRVVLMSGYAEADPDHEANREAIIRKPFDARTLVRRVREEIG